MVSHGLSYLLTLILCPQEQLSPFCHGKDTKVPAGRLVQLYPEQPGSSFHPPAQLESWHQPNAEGLDCAWTQGSFWDTKSNCAASVTEERLRETFPDSNIGNITHLNKQ